MSKQAGGGSRPPRQSVSLSGKPKAFSHVKGASPSFNDAASGKREKQAVRKQAPQLKKGFHRAHEGPREKIAKPKLHMAYRPSGKVVAEVHTKHDNEARLRNRQKDMQMKKWRDQPITMSRRFNAQAQRPMHLRQKKTPEVFSGAARKAAMKKLLQKKKDQSRGGPSH